MATRKTAKAKAQETVTQETAAPSPAAVSAETASEEKAAVEKDGVIVCAYEGTEDLMKRLWDRFHKGVHRVISVRADADTRDALISCLADETVADDFILVPANVVPCAEVSDGLLGARFVYVTRGGERRHDSRVPLRVSKSELVDALAAEDSQTVSAEVFVGRLNAGKRLNEVSFSFGNFITPVLRGNPCENVVIEAFIRKFFISASPEGFNAVSGLLEKYLLKG